MKIMKACLGALIIAFVFFISINNKDRDSFSSVFGTQAGEFFYGKCNLEFKSLIEMERISPPDSSEVSTLFKDARFGTPIYPVSKKDETVILKLITPKDELYSDVDNITIHKKPSLNSSTISFKGKDKLKLYSYEFDNCGNRIGDVEYK